MKIYNFYGYSIIGVYLLACAYVAPESWGMGYGALIGALYLAFVWIFGGLYLADVLHLGIAHRSLDYKEWFIKAVTVFTCTFAIYVDPIAWVNRHRLHHTHSDHEGDPNKLASDGFWQTFYRCLMPYPCKENVATDPILQSATFRLMASNWYAIPAQIFSFWLLYLIAGGLTFAVVLWIGVRVFALWVNMIQNYWTHTRTFGTRRYDDPQDNAMNIGELFPVMSTFSACLQNNHHHYPKLLRLSHSDDEWDFGFLTVKWMKALGLVKETPIGARIPADVPLTSLGF